MKSTGFRDINNNEIFEDDRLELGCLRGTVEFWEKYQIWMWTVDYDPCQPELGVGWSVLEGLAEKMTKIGGHQ